MAATLPEQLRVPPQNLDAERGVLGSILLLNEAIDDVGEVLRAELEALSTRFPFVADVRGKGLFMGAELYADPVARTPLPQPTSSTRTPSRSM